MSWRASAYVKGLRLSKTDHKIDRGEKLVLLILADYHHDEKGYAEVSLPRLAEESLYVQRHLIRIIQLLEKKGFLFVLRERLGARNEINRYYIIGVATPPETTEQQEPAPAITGDIVSPPPDTECHPGSDILEGGGSDISPPFGSDIQMSPKQVKPNGKTRQETPLSTKADEWAAVQWLFKYYLDKFRRDPERYTLTDKRKQKALMRLRERLKIHNGVLKTAVADLKHAIDALSKSQFHIEGKFIEWDKHLFNSTEKLEMWLNRSGGGGGPPGVGFKSASQRMKEGL